MSELNALIIDDEPDIRELLSITLGRMQLSTESAHNIEDAKKLLQNKKFSICLTDLHLPDGNGIELVEYVQSHYPDMPIAVITAFGSMDTAISALKAGAFDYLSKPIELNQLREIVSNAIKLDNDLESDQEQQILSHIPGQSTCIQKLNQLISRLSRSQAAVYINGESGSGKELVARQIHALSPRKHGPFIPVNCGAIPTELMESEFFGHKKGSFTGAVEDKIGLFQAAHTGTLFLDEVADLPLAMQVKLLRSIQEKKVRPIGSQKEMSVDVRILSATHKDLYTLVENEHFRQDLYYRINVLQLDVPPLRDRPEDIPMLANSIIEKICNNWEMPTLTLQPETIHALQNYSFPGNVRELENILERALTLCDGHQITPGHLQLPSHLQQSSIPNITTFSGHISLEEHLNQIERDIILQTLEKNRWNRTQAAKTLKMTMRSLRYRLQKLGIQDEQKDEK